MGDYYAVAAGLGMIIILWLVCAERERKARNARKRG